jgi:hypothetical protein
VASLPRRLALLKSELRCWRLRSHFYPPAATIDPAKACPVCGSEMKVTVERPHPGFLFAGLEDTTYLAQIAPSRRHGTLSHSQSDIESDADYPRRRYGLGTRYHVGTQHEGIVKAMEDGKDKERKPTGRFSWSRSRQCTPAASSPRTSVANSGLLDHRSIGC